MTYKDKKVKEALKLIKEGECLIYPTETLYALGANALNKDAALQVCGLKGREADKPLPLIIGSWKQLDLVTSWSKEISCLAKIFWPGPLSILVPARLSLAPFVYDQKGWTSVRLTSHPLAQQLCQQAEVPLIATSANLCGDKAVADPQKLDPRLTEKVKLVFRHKPWPSGGPPSTLLRLLDTDQVEILRSGAITVDELQKRGFRVS